MKSSSLIKTAATVTLLSGLALSAQAAPEQNPVAHYLDAVVDTHMAETRLELTNQTFEVVSNTAYQYSLDSETSTQLVAKVQIKMLSAEEALTPKNNGAE
ncbi:hypothetical protein QTP81_11550 [Alteromonas sp. ASW11-36]|uniref:Uncharacterized protein n=1 Tax=Alteromonas arenosi TaxID=3055817 RepID=A0ABT7SYZ4_9ALTE|nr:hypothetical protein [Alteromonas sp. ASW11-36]MDM7861229.1 hypothetical protein [Alteromonas sp. ASW11-36]